MISNIFKRLTVKSSNDFEYLSNICREYRILFEKVIFLIVKCHTNAHNWLDFSQSLFD